MTQIIRVVHKDDVYKLPPANYKITQISSCRGANGHIYVTALMELDKL